MLKLPKGLLKLEKNSLVFFECDRSRDWVGFCITPKFLCGCAAGAVAGGGAPPELVPPGGRLMAGKGGGGFHSRDRKWGIFSLYASVTSSTGTIVAMMQVTCIYSSLRKLLWAIFRRVAAGTPASANAVHSAPV